MLSFPAAALCISSGIYPAPVRIRCLGWELGLTLKRTSPLTMKDRIIFHAVANCVHLSSHLVTEDEGILPWTSMRLRRCGHFLAREFMERFRRVAMQVVHKSGIVFNTIVEMSLLRLSVYRPKIPRQYFVQMKYFEMK